MRYPRLLIVVFVVLGIAALHPAPAGAADDETLDETLERVDSLAVIAQNAETGASLARWGGIVDALGRSTDLPTDEADALARAITRMVMVFASAGERTGVLATPDIEDVLDAALVLATSAEVGGEQATAKASFLAGRAAEVTERMERSEEQAMETLVSPAPAPTVAGPVERWRSLVERYFAPDLVEEALAIIACESNGDPAARNGRSGAAGLFQFIGGTWKHASAMAGFAGVSPYEPEANIAAGAWLAGYSLDRGNAAWFHWTCRP